MPPKKVSKKSHTTSPLHGTKLYRQYTDKDVVHAIGLVKQGGLSVYKAAKQTGIPWSSLKRFISEQSDENRDVNLSECYLPKLGRPFVLSIGLEQRLFKYIIQMQELGFGLTVNKIRALAYDLAKAYNKEKQLNSKTQTAGKTWWKSFKIRYGLSLRTPENSSAYRASLGNPYMINDARGNNLKMFERKVGGHGCNAVFV